MKEELDRQTSLVRDISQQTTWRVVELLAIRVELDQLAQKYSHDVVVDQMLSQHARLYYMHGAHPSPHMAIRDAREQLEQRDQLRIVSERVNAFVRKYGTRAWRRL